jgi:hexosaminidase
VVPEIDIPGHCRACIEALPGLLRDPEDTSEYRSVQFFDDNVLNPGLPGTYEFLDTVLAEVCELFPGPYVHMGADEVPEGVWLGSEACRQLMQREGYQDPRELQGHLLRHAQTFLAARGRTLVGWEEAAQDDKLDRDTPICAWTGDAAVRQLVAAGYPVISCPAPRAYLDVAWSEDPREPGLHWAGTADLEACYRQSPFPDDVSNAMGVQANLWSELLHSREQLEYMLFPRLLATAEWGWRGRADNWPEFRSRAERALAYLRSRGVRPRPLEL